MAQEGYGFYENPSSDGHESSITAVDPVREVRPPRPTMESAESSSSFTHVSPPNTRSSSDSVPRSAWTENGDARIVDPSFDETILRSLCDMDCGVPLLLDRIKQSMVSCREASQFLRKRAIIEEEYGKNLQKLARSTSEAYATSDGKAGSFVKSWQTSMQIHDQMAENKLRFAQRLNEMSEELAGLTKEVEKNRKQTKELAGRYERALQESELATDKCKNRLDQSTEELERLLLQKEGESSKDTVVQSRQTGPGAGGKRAIGKAVAKGGMLLKGKNPASIQRQEDDIRSRVSSAGEAYQRSVTDTQQLRQEYFNFQLPRILRALKECTDEIDLGTQYHLQRYAFLFESTILSDGSTLTPSNDDGAPTAAALSGLKATMESINNREDFRTFMQHYAYARAPTTPRGPRREGPADEGFLPPMPHHNAERNASVPTLANGSQTKLADKGRPTFGVDLEEQMTRDNAEVPPIMAKCCKAIEKYGLTSQGIYRLSGTTSKVQVLKQKLDKDLDSVDLDSTEWSSDVNNITSVLKMWLRELPDPLVTFKLRQGFIDAAKVESPRLRHIRLHERVNDLPDANYATFKFFLGHLYRINQEEAENSMTIQNLAIVFGPTLFGQMLPGPGTDGQMNGMNGMADTTYQNLAIETILSHYKDIFVEEDAA